MSDEPKTDRPRAANPFSPQTSPAAHENWEREQAALDVTAEEARRQLQSARFEDAGLHPQGFAAQGTVQVQSDVGDSGGQRARPAKAPVNEHGETAAEQYRRELAGQPPSTTTVAEQSDERTRPAGTFSQDVSGNPDEQNVSDVRVTVPTAIPEPTLPPDPDSHFEQGQEQPAGAAQGEPTATPDNPLPPPFTPPVEPTEATITHPSAENPAQTETEPLPGALPAEEHGEA
jgi:hypothetical protein